MAKASFLTALLLIAILCAANTATARARQSSLQPLLDSLALLPKEDGRRIALYNELAYQVAEDNRDYLLSLAYADSAQVLAQQQADKRGEGTAWSRSGRAYKALKDYPKAIDAFSRALRLAQDSRYPYGIYREANNLARLYRDLSQYQQAEEYNLLGIQAIEQDSLTTQFGWAYMTHGSILNRQNIYDSAQVYLQKALSLNERYTPQHLPINYRYLGLLNHNLQLYQEAIRYYKLALDFSIARDDQAQRAYDLLNIGSSYRQAGKADSALAYFRNSLRLKELAGVGISASLYNNLGLVYYDLGRYDSAAYFLERSLEVSAQVPDTMSLANTYMTLGLIAESRNQATQSKNYFLNAYRLSSKVISDSSNAGIHTEILNKLYRYYQEAGDYDTAFLFQNELAERNRRIQARIVEAMRLKSQFEEAQYQKREAQNQLEVSRERAEKYQVYAYLLGALVLLFVFVFFFLSSRRLLARRKRQHREKVNELLGEQQTRIESAMLEGQEEERTRIARDLHDRMGSLLSMAKLHVKAVEEDIATLEEPKQQQYHKANHLLEEAVGEVRRIAHNMMSGTLQKFGLVAALEDLKATITETSPMRFELIISGIQESLLPPSMEMQVFRIIQELISNVLKHAAADEITLQLLVKKSSILLMIEDNGQGFDPDKQPQKGMGLQSIENRASKLEGSLLIDSGKGNGTTITIEIPLPNPEAL